MKKVFYTLRNKKGVTVTVDALDIAQQGLSPLFPWFGSKRKVAEEVWKRIGDTTNYVEPFAGSAAVLLARPNSHTWWEKFETVNDIDGLLSNWFRAVAADPGAVAAHAAWPVNEADLTARHLWLVQHRESLTARLMADPAYYDARFAGWWVWGICAWVGGDWCTGIGPHTGGDTPSVSNGGTAPGVYRKVPMISGGHGGKGVHRPRHVTGSTPSVISGLVPDLTASHLETLTADFTAVANRLRRVRVTCGSWDRVTRQAAVAPAGHVTGVFLDPPYDQTERRGDLYGVGDRPENRGTPIAEAARAWAIEHGSNPAYRVAYCGYAADPDTPAPRGGTDDDMFATAGWTAFRWTASGGYSLRSDNRARTNRDREVVWFSPTCLTPNATAAMEPLSLFDSEPTSNPREF